MSTAGGSAAGGSRAVPTHWNSVFDRLADPATFTGVYAERFISCVARRRRPAPRRGPS